MYKLLIIILLFGYSPVMGQWHQLQGILLDKYTATVVPGARLSNQSGSAVTDSNGRFVLRMPPSDTTIEITTSHYKTEIRTLSPRQNFVTFFIKPSENIPPPKNSYNEAASLSNPIKAYQDETYQNQEENPFVKTSESLFSDFTLNGNFASYNNIRRFLRKKKAVPPASVRIAEMINYFSLQDSLPESSPNIPILRAFADISTCPWQKGHWLMRLAVPCRKLPDSIRRPSNIVLLIDVSGSMSKPDKLPLLKIAFKQLVRHLRDRDTLSIVIYSGKSALALPPTAGKEKDKILNTLKNLYAGGATAGGKGIEMAFKLAKAHFIPHGNNHIIIATDGDFNVGKSSDPEMKKLIMRYHNWGIDLTCIGVGTGNYKDSKLETLAHWGQGNFVYLDTKEEAQKLYNKNYLQIMYVAARNASIKTIFNPSLIQSFRLIGYGSDQKPARSHQSIDHFPPGGAIGVNQRMTAYYELVPQPALINGSLSVSPTLANADTLATFILQYSGRKKNQQHLQIYKVPLHVWPFKKMNNDWRFGASIALFGMLLQHSEYKGTGNYDMARKMARQAKNAVSKNDYKNYQQLLQQAKKYSE